MYKLLCLVLPALLLAGGSAIAQDSSGFAVTQLTDHIYMLSTDDGPYTTNVLASVGDDGLLLVDTDTEAKAEELKKIVESFGKGLPKYIIFTHRHIEHIGGAAIFGPSPVVIAHYLLPAKLRTGAFIFEEFPPATYPDITFADSLSLFFNGEEIRLVNIAGSHDDNEIMVHFTGSKVAHVSSIINGMNFPSIDVRGNALKFEEVVSRVIDLLPEDVTIVSGHNGLATWQDLHTDRDMLHESTAIVRAGLEAGKDIATIQGEHPLAKFEAFNKSYVSPDEWIAYLAKAIEEEQHPTPERLSTFEPLYYALKEGGVEAATRKYYELKNDSVHTYRIDEVPLLIIGDKLLEKGRIQEAVGILKLELEEYPEGTYAYYTHFDLATAYKNAGDKKLASEHCRKVLELKPDFKPAVQLEEEINKM